MRAPVRERSVHPPLAVVALGALLGLVACKSEPERPPDPPQPEGTGDTGPEDTAPATPPEPWEVRQHDGSVVIRRDGALSPGQQGFLEMYGMFADDLTGATSGLWCVEKGVCVRELPERVGDSRDLDAVIRRGQTYYDWVGERVTVGNDPRDWLEIPFVPDLLTDYGVYRGGANRIDPDEVPPFDVRFEGQWGDVVVEDGVGLPLLPRLTSPASAEIPVSLQVEFAWSWPPPEAGIDVGEGDLYLRLASNEVDRIWRLPNEGPYTVDLAGLGLNNSSNVSLYFGRWTHQQVTVGRGNTLDLYGVSEVRRSMPQCTSYPNWNYYENPRQPPLEPVMDVGYIGVGFQGLLDLGDIHDYRADFDGDTFMDPQSSVLIFSLYDKNFQPLCDVTYDASNAARQPDVWSTDSGAVMFEAYTLRPSSGVSTCNQVDEALFGSRDIRVLLESFTWGFGFGETKATEEPLAEFYGDDWETVKAETWGFFVKLPESEVAFELSAGPGFRLNECATLDPAMVPVKFAPGAPMTSAVHAHNPVYLLSF